MRGLWIAIILLAAIVGGSVTGYILNLEFQVRNAVVRQSNAPETISIVVSRIKFKNVRKDVEPPRFSTPGIVDITPREGFVTAVPASLESTR